MILPLRPKRGGFLRPFGCGWFIREYLLGKGPYGSLKIDPETGLLANSDTDNPKFECFKKGTVPTQYTPASNKSQSDDFLIIDLEEENIYDEYKNDINEGISNFIIKSDGEEEETIPIAIP